MGGLLAEGRLSQAMGALARLADENIANEQTLCPTRVLRRVAILPCAWARKHGVVGS